MWSRLWVLSTPVSALDNVHFSYFLDSGHQRYIWCLYNCAILVSIVPSAIHTNPQIYNSCLSPLLTIKPWLETDLCKASKTYVTILAIAHKHTQKLVTIVNERVWLKEEVGSKRGTLQQGVNSKEGMWSLEVRGNFSPKGHERRVQLNLPVEKGSSLWWVTCLGFPHITNTQWSLHALETEAVWKCGGLAPACCLGAATHSLVIPLKQLFVFRTRFSSAHANGCVWEIGYLHLWFCTTMILYSEEEQKVRLKRGW